MERAGGIMMTKGQGERKRGVGTGGRLDVKEQGEQGQTA